MSREAIREGAVRTAGAVSRRKGKGKDSLLMSRMCNTDQNRGMGWGHLVCYLPAMCISVTKKSRQADPLIQCKHLQHARQCIRRRKQRLRVWQNARWSGRRSWPPRWLREAAGASGAAQGAAGAFSSATTCLVSTGSESRDVASYSLRMCWKYN